MDGAQQPLPPPNTVGAAIPQPTTKRQKTNHGSDFSGNVREKITSSRRTGQACDRCKTRKIRCDSQPGGCTPCRQNNVKCTTVDRNTGRATSRGYTEQIEDENRWLKARLQEHEHRLKQAGIQFKPALPEHVAMEESVRSHANGGSMIDPSIAQLPTRASIGEPYAGTSLNGPPLISVASGTKLFCLGVEVDIEHYVMQRQSETDYTEWSLFWNQICNKIERIPEPPLPARQEDFDQYALWYFRSLNAYTPALDKRDMHDWINKYCNDPNWMRTPAQTALMHIMLAHLKYQMSQRSQDVPDGIQRAESFAHFRYALSFVYDCCMTHTIQDMQALTLIALHLRNFDLPGVSWAWSAVVMTQAVNLGYHRSPKAIFIDSKMPSSHEIEMRKRVFWVLYGVHTGLAGKLRHTTLVRPEDIDIEFPEPLPDCIPGEQPMTAFQACSFVMGIHTQKIMAIFGKMYASIYALKRPSLDVYEKTVRDIEQDIRQWRAQVPVEIADASKASGQTYVYALYLDYWESELRLLLHHPTLCPYMDPKLLRANEDACVSAAKHMLRAVIQLRKERSLDMPWVTTVVYIAAIFTVLFVAERQPEPISLVDYEELRSDMSLWSQVIADCGEALGSGKKLNHTISDIVQASLFRITQKRLPQEFPQDIVQQPPQDIKPPVNIPQQPQYTVPTYAPIVQNTSPAPNYAVSAVPSADALTTAHAPNNYAYAANMAQAAPYATPNSSFETYMPAPAYAVNNPPYQDWQNWAASAQHMAQSGVPPEVGALVALGGVKDGVGGMASTPGATWPMNLNQPFE